MAIKSLQEVKKNIENYINVLEKNKIKPKKVFLFGSYAKGTWGGGSDIDLGIVDIFHNSEYSKRLRKYNKLALLADKAISIVLLNEEDLNNPISPVTQEILGTGIELNL